MDHQQRRDELNAMLRLSQNRGRVQVEVRPMVQNKGTIPNDDTPMTEYLAMDAGTPKYPARLEACSRCTLCETTGEGAKLWSKCRAMQRMRLGTFMNQPLACCPAGNWLPRYPLLEWGTPTQEAGIIIGSDDKATWLVTLFVRFLRKHTGSKLPIYCADFGLTTTSLPVDAIIQVPGEGLHPMYRKAAAAMVAPFRCGIWYDTDILVRIAPELALEELERSGHDLAIRRGEKWWQIKHRADNWHTGVYAYKHGSETLRQWASWSMMGDKAWVTAEDYHHIRDEELFAELIRTQKLPVHDLSACHARLPSEFNAKAFGMPEIDCTNANWHFPGKEAKQRFRQLAEEGLQTACK